MKYFVTGGAGFIGSHLVDALIKKDKVTVYDNLSSGKIEFIKHHLNNKRFNFIKSDLLNLKKLKRCLAGYDAVFHLSANPDARLGIANTSLDLNQETIATYNVLEAMRSNRVKKIVFASSGTIYGETPVIPLPENYGPVLPISLYGAGKVASEGLISAFCHTFDMQAWIFRFANIIGGRATHGVIFDFINKLMKNNRVLEILGDGTQEKPYLYIDDCINGIIFGWENSKGKVNVFNLGCESSTDVTSIANIIVKEMGLKNVRYKYTGGDRGWAGDVPQVRFNCKKINALGWKARYSSEEAVKLAVKIIIKELAEK